MSNIISTFQISGMHCDACAKLITRMVSKKIADDAQVSNIAVDKETNTAEITAGREISSEEVKTALKGTEYSIVE